MIFLIITLKVILIILLTYAIYNCIKYIQENRAFEKSARKMFIKAEGKYRNRQEEELRKRFEEGNQEKISFFYKIDLMLERSGLRKKIKFLNTEIYLGIALVASSVAFISATIVTGAWIIGIIVFSIIVLMFYLIIYIMSGLNYEKVEGNILTFVNLLENYSQTNDDIVTIFGKIYEYLEEPLRGYIELFYEESISTGDVTKAFRNLENRIENTRFKEIIRNLEICSRHEANYQEIIKDCRYNLKEYLKNLQKKKAIIQNGRASLSMALGTSGFLVYMFSGFVPNLSEILITSPIGNAIILYCIVIVAICIGMMLGFDRKGD